MLFNLHFIRPWWFLACIPISVIIWKLLFRQLQTKSWEKACDHHLLPHLLTGNHEIRQQWPIVALGCLLFLIIFSLSGPSWQDHNAPVYRSLQSQVIVLNLSPSMLAIDIKPDRLTRAKYKISDLLKKTQDGFTGMIVFANEPYVVSPLTEDVNTIAAMIPILSPDIMPVGGSNIRRALLKSKQLLQQSGASHGQIILVTDGFATNKDIETAKQLASSGNHISVLALGTEEGSPIPLERGGFLSDEKGAMILAKLDPRSLTNLAMAGNGRFVPFTNDDSDITYLLGSDLMPGLTDAKKVDTPNRLWEDEGKWFILLLLPFAALAFRRGWLSD